MGPQARSDLLREVDARCSRYLDGVVWLVCLDLDIIVMAFQRCSSTENEALGGNLKYDLVVTSGVLRTNTAFGLQPAA
jgi:hypothetical protein